MTRIVESARTALQTGKPRRDLLVLPTGAGKTVVAVKACIELEILDEGRPRSEAARMAHTLVFG